MRILGRYPLANRTFTRDRGDKMEVGVGPPAPRKKGQMLPVDPAEKGTVFFSLPIPVNCYRGQLT